MHSAAEPYLSYVFDLLVTNSLDAIQSQLRHNYIIHIL